MYRGQYPLLLVVKREVSAQAVALDVWQRGRNCWWIMFYKVILFARGTEFTYPSAFIAR
jgi:hypothetical protein